MDITITNEIHFTDLGCQLDLKQIYLRQNNVILKYRPFAFLLWKHRAIGVVAMIYQNGKILVHGSKSCVRKYARQLQRMGYPIKLTHIKLVTMTGCYKSGKKLVLEKIAKYLNTQWNPELFNGLIVKRHGVTFIIYYSGTIILSGLRRNRGRAVDFLKTIESL